MQHPLILASAQIWPDSQGWAEREAAAIEAGLAALPTEATDEARAVLTALARRVSVAFTTVAQGTGTAALNSWYLETTHRICSQAEALFPSENVLNRPNWTGQGSGLGRWRG